MVDRAKVVSHVRVKTYALLSECVTRGIDRGIARAHKHTETPSAEHLREQIENAVLAEICEWFEFE